MNSMTPDSLVFTLAGKELEAAKAWVAAHRCEQREHSKLSYTSFPEYAFCPNSIGTAVIVRCSYCGLQENVTDFSQW